MIHIATDFLLKKEKDTPTEKQVTNSKEQKSPLVAPISKEEPEIASKSMKPSKPGNADFFCF